MPSSKINNNSSNFSNLYNNNNNTNNIKGIKINNNIIIPKINSNSNNPSTNPITPIFSFNSNKIIIRENILDILDQICRTIKITNSNLSELLKKNALLYMTSIN